MLGISCKTSYSRWGVATYKTADEIDPELLKALPPKEELQRVFEESSKKEDMDGDGVEN